MTPDTHAHLIMSTKLRSKFGPLLNSEPTIEFFVDGRIRVSGNGMSFDLTKEMADKITSNI